MPRTRDLRPVGFRYAERYAEYSRFPTVTRNTDEASESTKGNPVQDLSYQPASGSSHGHGHGHGLFPRM